MLGFIPVSASIQLSSFIKSRVFRFTRDFSSGPIWKKITIKGQLLQSIMHILISPTIKSYKNHLFCRGKHILWE